MEQISLMRPKCEGEGSGKDSSPGLLEYLEDIIGTDRLVPQIEEEGKRWGGGSAPITPDLPAASH